MTAEHLTLTAGQATFGPWRTTLERDAQGTRTDIELDPVVKGGPSAVYVRTPAGAVSIHVNVPKSPLSRIGVPPKSVGLGSDPDLEAQITFDETLAGASTLTAAITLSRAVFSGMPVDAVLPACKPRGRDEGARREAGDARGGADQGHGVGDGEALRRRRAPGAGLDGATGPLHRDGEAARGADARAAARGRSPQDVGDIVGLRVTGEALASGLITLDSRDVSASELHHDGERDLRAGDVL